MAWDRHRVWTAGSVVVVVGRAERERARIDEASDFVADAADRAVWNRLAIVGLSLAGLGEWTGGGVVWVGLAVRRRIGRN